MGYMSNSQCFGIDMIYYTFILLLKLTVPKEYNYYSTKIKLFHV